MLKNVAAVFALNWNEFKIQSCGYARAAHEHEQLVFVWNWTELEPKPNQFLNISINSLSNPNIVFILRTEHFNLIRIKFKSLCKNVLSRELRLYRIRIILFAAIPWEQIGNERLSCWTSWTIFSCGSSFRLIWSYGNLIFESNLSYCVWTSKSWL